LDDYCIVRLVRLSRPSVPVGSAPFFEFCYRAPPQVGRMIHQRVEQAAMAIVEVGHGRP
jgi:hypothetical protein